VWVQPGAKRNEVAGVRNGRLRLRLRAPAVEGKANKALALYVAELIGVKPSQVTLEIGQTSRGKVLFIQADEEPDWANVALQPPS